MPYNDLVSWGWKVWEIMFLIATLKFCSLLAVYWREKTLVHPQIKILYIAISMPDISLSLNAAYYSHTQKVLYKFPQNENVLWCSCLVAG